MKVEEFFDEVYYGDISDIDIYNTVEKLTDGYDETKLNLLCRDFDFYCFMKEEEFLGSFSHEEIEKKMHEIEKAGKKIPLVSDSNRSPLSVSAYFKLPEHKKIKKEKDWSDEDIKRWDEFFSEMRENQKITLDVKRLMDPHGVEFFSLHRLKSLLVDLKRKHTNSIYRFDDKEPQVNNTQPIHWLKGEESLRQFLDIIKSAGLIDNRETDDIIQEHFLVDGQEPIKEPQPINWLKSKVLLAYLIQELSTKPNMHKPFIEPDKKWQLTELHFTVKGKEIGRSLVNDIKQSRFPNGCEEIDSILKRLTKH